MIHSPVDAGFVALLGLIFGSLGSALSHRLPRGLPVVADRSRCPACGQDLGARDLIPVLSWIVQGGRCRHCHAPISWRYPAIEATTSVLFIAAWLVGGGLNPRAFLLALTGFGLVVISVADLEEGVIPDVMLLFLLPVAAAWRHVTAGSWIDGAMGAAFGVGASLFLRWAFSRLRGVDALGLGDVKFFGLAGLYLGLSGFGHFLAIGGVIGIVSGLAWRAAGRGPTFPFAPALSATLAAILFFGVPGR